MTKHGGPVHQVRNKAELARHIGEDHVDVDGRVHRVAWPSAGSRARWSLQELTMTHADMHEGSHPVAGQGGVR